MNEPLDDDDCRPHWSDPVDDEIAKLTGDNMALRRMLRRSLVFLETYMEVHKSEASVFVKLRDDIRDELKND